MNPNKMTLKDILWIVVGGPLIIITIPFFCCFRIIKYLITRNPDDHPWI